MAKIFYYDSAGISDAIITAGTFSAPTFTASSGAITGEHKINDQSIAEAVSGFSDEDMIRINFGSAKTVSKILKYNTIAETDDLWWYRSDSATDTGSNGGVWAFDNDTPAGWDTITGTQDTKQYWFIRSEETSSVFSGLAEVIMGVPLEFEVEPDIGINTSEQFGTITNVSLGGIEYSYKKHNPRSTWTLNFKNISKTFRDNLASMEQNVTDFKKFVYYDDTNYNYVKLNGPLTFTEVAFERYSVSIKLIEQLS